MKTNKAFANRFKVTGNGKVLARKAGQNHFNGKESRRYQITEKKKLQPFAMPNKAKHHFLGA
ncbi:MAG: bL35 family ribosomal protein [Candidatus Paceibacterota bacterium]